MSIQPSKKLLAEVDRVKNLQAYKAGDPVTSSLVAECIHATAQYAYIVLDYMRDTGLMDKKKRNGRVVYVRTASSSMPFNWRINKAVYTEKYTPTWY